MGRTSAIALGAASAAAAFAGGAYAQIPALTVSGNQPVYDASLKCQDTPPTVSISATSALITIQLEYSREITSDNLGAPADVSPFTGFFFRTKTETRDTLEGSDFFLGSDNLDTSRFDTTGPLYDFPGVCDGADVSQSLLFAAGGTTTTGGACSAAVSNGTVFGVDEGCDPILADGTCADATAANEWTIESIAVPAGASCNARYRASFSTTIADFEDTTTITTVRNFAGSRTIEFDGYIVELAPQGSAGSASDHMIAQFTRQSFEFAMTTTAQIVYALDAADLLQPIMMQVNSVEGQRLENSPSVGYVDYELSLWVRQAVESSVADEVTISDFALQEITSSGFPTTASGNAVCGVTSYAYPTGSRVTVAGNALPASVQNKLTSAAIDAGLFWVEYVANLQCNMTDATVTHITTDLPIDAHTLVFNYELTSAANGVVSDSTTASDMPELSFTASLTLPGKEEVLVELELQSSIVRVDESELNTGYASFTPMIESQIDDADYQDVQPGVDSLSWSEAALWHVELKNSADRDYYGVRPLLQVIIAHANDLGTYEAANYTYLGTGTGPLSVGSGSARPQLQEDWCGMNAASAVGALALTDDDTQSSIEATSTEKTEYQAGTNTLTHLQAVRDRILAATYTPPGDASGTVIPWGTFISTNAAEKLAEMLLVSPFTKTDIDSFANLPDTTGAVAQATYALNDGAGGFVTPFRNRFRLSTGEGGGYSLTMCALVNLVQHRPFTVGADANLYVNENAAIAASPSSGATSVIASDGQTYYTADARRRSSARRLQSFDNRAVPAEITLVGHAPAPDQKTSLAAISGMTIKLAPMPFGGEDEPVEMSSSVNTSLPDMGNIHVDGVNPGVVLVVCWLFVSSIVLVTAIFACINIFNRQQKSGRKN